MSSFSEEISSNDGMGSDEEMVSNEEIDSEEFGSDFEMKSSEEFIDSDDEGNYSEDGSRYESSITSIVLSPYYSYLAQLSVALN
ncbi:protein AATF [Aphis craccivora]|uniref:Protein AATF n=1 Tax=Aphis craccivora TaxID=307492 RepID=A0A6G0YLK4_APHCR|nr:protein AATF [Aphis craccivora]